MLAYFGTGTPFPFAPSAASGAISTVSGTDKVLQSIQLILDTEPGERLMRPAFGCGLRRYLMEANTVATRALIQRDVEAALSTWEPRIELTSVTVEPGNEPSLVVISISYVHVRDRRPNNLIYPFYLE
jgi:uncharacterized protein